MVFSLVIVFVFLECEITCFDRGTNSGGKIWIKLYVGKIGSKPEQDQDIHYDLSEELYELLTSLGTGVTNLIFQNDDVVWVSWKHSENNIAAGKKVNVAVAAYVTTQARLKLYEYLSELGNLSCTVIQTVISSFKM